MTQSLKQHRCVAFLKAGLAVMLLVDNRGRAERHAAFCVMTPDVSATGQHTSTNLNKPVKLHRLALTIFKRGKQSLTHHVLSSDQKLARD
ncbi:hypothetical protein [Limnohabitans sp.]|uniref:hypothetical protein n=1 Tax=Limnohabitans sp. TaxID=1907725 RepID=UPI0038B7937E